MKYIKKGLSKKKVLAIMREQAKIARETERLNKEMQRDLHLTNIDEPEEG